MGIQAQFALANRRAIAAKIERLIELLDIVDGDCDLEPDHDDGDLVDRDGEIEDWRPGGFELPLPRYGVDQSEGPTNKREGERAWHKRMMAS